MISARCMYIISPRKQTIEATDYIIAKFETNTENVPVKYRNGKKMIEFTAKGKGYNVNKKFNSLFEGKWNFNEKYNQLELFVEKSDIALPSDSDGIKTYLSTFLEGCGPRTAEKIYKRFGQATLLVLNSEPSKLLEVPGIRKKQLDRMMKSYASAQKLQELSLLLSPYGIGKAKITKIYDAWGEKTIERIKEEPFCLNKFRGFSFETLDFISQNLRCDANSVFLLPPPIL